MPTVLEATFWDPRFVDASRMRFQGMVNRAALLKRVVSAVPLDRAHVDFLEDRPGDRLVMLFTYDLENPVARSNEAWLLTAFAGTGAIRFYGVEGSAGTFKVDSYRRFPDRMSMLEVSEYLFRAFLLSPIEWAALECRDEVFLWGIETPELYLAALERFKTNAPDYGDAIRRRQPALFQNLLDKMEERNECVAGVCLTMLNYWFGHEWLTKHGIANAGLSAVAEGPDDRGRYEAALRNEPYDEEQARMFEIFADWQRPTGWQPRKPKFRDD